INALQPVVTATPLPSSDEAVKQLLSYEVNIAEYFDNKAFGDNANFDDGGAFFPGAIDTKARFLINYNTRQTQNYDNIKADGQKISLNFTELGALYMLVSASHGPYTDEVSVVYKDGTKTTTALSLPDWQDIFVNQMDRYQAIQFPTSIDGQQGALFSVPVFIDPTKVPDHLLLPTAHAGSYETMHVFSVTAYQTSTTMITSVQTTNEWVSQTDQILLVKIQNTSPIWIKDVKIQLDHPHVKTIKNGLIEAVAPGHIQTAQIIVQNMEQKNDVNVTMTIIHVENGVPMTNNRIVPLILDASPGQYQAATTSVQKHRPPTWLKQSKFGIFIHWGLFSVPSWAPVGKAYAEWYWWRMNHKDDAAFDYHHQTYGEKFEYDEFLKEWKPTLFDPHAWLDLIDKSGAKYYVFTTKHHDGIALFDSNITERTSTHLLNPPRNFVQELLSVSETAYPHLKRGLYFSLPEWYHPKYNDESLGWKGPPKNPYTDEVVSYTGSRLIEDFVNELQVPQLQELANNYNPDILWCDIGGINNSTVWQSDYFNNALKDGRQVSVNDRCGDGSASDFTTIEYKAVTDTPTRFWEATRGMDPFSFGYNRETKPEDYASTLDLIKDLVDAVSKGGNYLLNIGPEASGYIPESMSQRLLEIGQWLNLVNASIFDSAPYWIASSQDNLRFTANLNGKSIYVFSFMAFDNDILIKTPVPVQEGSVISLMNEPGVKINWNYDSEQGGVLLKWDSMNVSLIPVFEITTPSLV
ncbi:hypothetical protein INT47_000077, partial [Mucor saturninus]